MPSRRCGSVRLQALARFETFEAETAAKPVISVRDHCPRRADQGMDVGARANVYEIIHAVAARGKGSRWSRARRGAGLIRTACSNTDEGVPNLTNLLLQMSIIGVVTLAELIVVLTGGIDISVGSALGLPAQ